MRRPSVLALALLSASIAVPCAAIQTRPPVCAYLADFANATQQGGSQSIEYSYVWGGEPGCDAGGTTAGERFCTWLLPNAAREWLLDSIRPLLACPAQGTTQFPGLFVAELSGNVVLIDPVGVDSHVSINVVFDADHFEITAKRRAPDDDPR